jgi:hypothetical protein
VARIITGEMGYQVSNCFTLTYYNDIIKKYIISGFIYLCLVLLEGKKEASHKGEGEGSSSAVNELEDKKEAPDQGEGEGSSSAVNELENLEKDSIDDSPYRP